MWAFGMIKKCTGATGRMSWNAKISSSSCTLLAGIAPRTILQKMQSSGVVGLVMLGNGSLPLGFGSVGFLPRRLLVYARDSFPTAKFLQHVGRAQAIVGEHDHAVKPKVRHLADDPPPLAVFAGHHGLGRLFTDLLEHRVLAGREQARDV